MAQRGGTLVPVGVHEHAEAVELVVAEVARVPVPIAIRVRALAVHHPVFPLPVVLE